MRHLAVVDGELKVVGMITRNNLNEHHLKHYWENEVRLLALPSPLATTTPPH